MRFFRGNTITLVMRAGLLCCLCLSANVRAQSGCEETADTMRQVNEQLTQQPDKDELQGVLQKLKYVTGACPNDGDAWYVRGKVEERLGLSATFSLSQARQHRSAWQKNSVDPFSKAASASHAAAPNPTLLPTSGNDTKPPVITITDPPIGRGVVVKAAANRFKIAGTATDESGLRAVTVHGAPVNFSAQGEFAVDLNLQPQDQQIVVTATDNAGVSAEVRIPLKRDLVETAGTVATNAPKVEGQFYALLIAVQDYQQAGVKDLSQPITDAQRLQQILTSAYVFAPANVSFLKDPTSAEIIGELARLKKTLRAEDHLLVFYAGHGHWEEDIKQGYWLPSDAQPENPAKWISNSTVRDLVRGIKARHTLLISDACFSGGILGTRAAFEGAPPSIQQLLALPSRTAMTSGTLTEVPDHSEFVKYLVKRLEENQAKFLSGNALFNSFREAVINNSRIMKSGQRTLPQYGAIQEAGHEGGDFIFVRKP